MRKEDTDLTLRERINDGLARNWKMVTGVFFGAFVIIAVVLVLGYLSKGKASDSAMLAEDIQSGYTEWIQQAPENRDDTELNEKISEALENYPKLFAAQRAYFTMGLMALENKDWDKASEAFLILADNWPDSYLASVSLFNAASAREESGDIEGSMVLLQRILDNYSEISPDAPEALFNLGRLAETQGNTSEALAYYKDVNARFPESRWTDLSKSRILVLESR